MIKRLDANVCLTHNDVCIDITIEDNTIETKVYEKDQYTETLYTDTLDKEQEYYQNILLKFGLSETDAKTISTFAIYNHEKTDDIRLTLPNDTHDNCYDKLISTITNKDKSLIKKEELEILAGKLDSICTYDNYIRLSNEEKKYYTRSLCNYSKSILKYHRLIAKLLNDYKEFADPDLTFYMECNKLKLEQKLYEPFRVTECIDLEHYNDLKCNCLSFKDLYSDDNFKKMFEGIDMSKYLNKTISFDRLKKIVQDNLKLKYTYLKNQNKTKTAIRKIASCLINNFDNGDVFNNINDNDLQTIMAEDWFTSEHKIENKTSENTIENDIYRLLYTNSKLDNNTLNQLYNEDNNKIVAHTDIIDLIVRFLKYTTEDDIL